MRRDGQPSGQTFGRFFHCDRRPAGRPMAAVGAGVTALLFCGWAGCVRAEIYTPPASGRAQINLNAGWRFLRQDVPAASNPAYDDSAWSVVDLPHTWNNLDGQDGGNNYYRGPGWYRRHYALGAEAAGRRCFLKFDGANIVTEVWVNGLYAGQHQGGFAAFVFDVTGQLNPGADNVIAVRVSNASFTNIPPLSADFTFYGGLYRDVHLLLTDPAHITPLDHGSPGVYLRTTNVSAGAADLEVTALVSNAGPAAAALVLRAVVTDAGSNIVAALTNGLTLPPGALSNAVLGATIHNPRLWDGLHDPYLYRVYAELRHGDEVVDWVSQPLGFRWFSVDPNQGFLLNGRSYPLRGVNLHQDWLDRGWAIGPAERATNFAIIRELGANTIRLAHYQHAEHTYQLADESGMVLWTEVPLVNRITESPEFYENSKQQLRELIRQNYNHPSVVCWGLFNEITLSSGPPVTNLVRELALLAKAEDPTRPSTAASAAADSHLSNWYSDIVSFNKYYGWYSGTFPGFGSWADSIHANYPTRCIGLSEYGAGASIWHHSEEPVAKPTPAGPFHPEEWQNLFHESHWQQIQARPWLWATHIWNLFDFGVDSRNEGDTPGRNDKGLVTYDRQHRKDAFYWYQANWTTNPMVHLTGHTFTNRLAFNLTAKVYANCDSVELFHNNVSKGVATSTNCIFTWPLTLVLGSNSVSVVGTKGTCTVTDALVWTLLPQPFRGRPLAIPGRLQAEEFNLGPEGAAYQDSDPVNSGGAYRTNEPVDIEVCRDTGGGFNVTALAAGEWLAYDVSIASAGYYTAQLRLAATNPSSVLRLGLDGRDLAGPILVPDTGGTQTWQTVTVTNLQLPAGAHELRVAADTGVCNLNWLSFTFQPAPGAFTLKINYQTTNAATPPGYLQDTGLIFGNRGNGHAYGWDGDNTANTRERNSTNSADKRYDTLIHLQKSSNLTWEVTVPNGRYTVHAVAGDPGYTDSRHELLAETAPLVSGRPASDRLWVEGAAEVVVGDGRLTIANAPEGVNNKLCFLEIAETLGASLGWRHTHFGTNANNLALAGDFADPDGDGLNNLLEYALNTSPLQANPVPPWRAGLEGGALSLTYARRLPPTDVRYLVEASGTVEGPWTNAVAEEILGSDGVFETVRAVDVVTNDSPRFLRLQISRP